MRWRLNESASTRQPIRNLKVASVTLGLCQCRRPAPKRGWSCNCPTGLRHVGDRRGQCLGVGMAARAVPGPFLHQAGEGVLSRGMADAAVHHGEINLERVELLSRPVHRPSGARLEERGE